MALIDKTSLTGISDKQRKVFEWFTCYLTVLEEGIMSFMSSAIVHRFPLGYSFNIVDGNEQNNYHYGTKTHTVIRSSFGYNPKSGNISWKWAVVFVCVVPTGKIV